MAFLHCHNCEFSQDDFWEWDGYNPISSFEDDKESLLNKDLDEVVKMDSYWLKERGLTQITRRELILYHLDQIKHSIKNMKYRTYDEYLENNPERKCPVCGVEGFLDID